MRVSLNKIREYTDIDVSTEELVDLINRRLGGVEETIDLGARYEKAIIVKVASAEQHPDADRLRVTKIDDGGVTVDVERDENGYVQVVCGAPNAREGILAVWLPPNATVPASFDEDELFVLGSRKLRGVLSHGMLAAADELAVGTDHAGIIEITEHDVSTGIDYNELVGKSFAKIFGLDDTIIEIENKMFTHRPDLFGQLGVAREIAGIQHKKFTSPEWYTGQIIFEDVSELPLGMFNEAQEVVRRFTTVVLKDIVVQQSPLWLQIELVRLGSKPINNVVDITNYIMLLTAQPTHAYDYDKLRGGKIGARMARAGETVRLLNDKTYELDESDIVIADGEGPIGLAGIMGGGESEVSSDTKNIVLEVANFDMYTLRRSSMRHGLFTDALTRFNKGQSLLQTAVVMGRLLHLMKDIIGAHQASDMYDGGGEASHDNFIKTDTQFINERLGLHLIPEEIRILLTNVELDVEGDLTIRPEFWRTDLELPEDIVEEVGRLYGYDRLPRALPLRSTKPAPKNAYRELASSVRSALKQAGANEVLTYSFVHGDILDKTGLNNADAYSLSNALSPDLQYYRLSLTPSLLDKVYANVRAGYKDFAIYEIGKAHTKKAELDEEGLPPEQRRIALTLTKSDLNGAPYYQAKVLLEHLTARLGLGELEYKPLGAAANMAIAKPFEPKRAARVIDAVSGQVIGIVGEYSSSVKRNFKLPNYTAGFELMTEGILLALATHGHGAYSALSRYPSVERDITFEVAYDTPHANVVQSLYAKAHEVAGETVKVTISPLNIYAPEEGDAKRVTVRVTFTPQYETLTGDRVGEIVDSITMHACSVLDAKVI